MKGAADSLEDNMPPKIQWATCGLSDEASNI